MDNIPMSCSSGAFSNRRHRLHSSIAAAVFGVSFDQDNLADAGNFPGLTRYVRGGAPISLPQKDAPFEKLDYGLVVFSPTDRNPAGQTITARWGGIPGALIPVQVPHDENHVTDSLCCRSTFLQHV